MANQPPEVDTAKEIARLNEELRRKEREIKGWKGRASRLERAGTGTKPNSSPAESESSEAKPAEVAKPHFTRSYEKVCTTCGEPNPEYKKPNVRCDNGSCHSPLGTFERDKLQKNPETGKPMIPVAACWNCGGKGAEFFE